MIASATRLAVLGALVGIGALARPAAASGNAWLGVVIEDAHYTRGARVTEVIRETPADRAGLQVGDIVVSVDGTKVTSAVSLTTAVGALAVGADVDLVIIRGRRSKTLQARLSVKASESEILARRLVGQPLPPFALPRLAGGVPVRTDDHLGDVVVLYFFAPGCSSCPALTQRLDQLQGTRRRDGVVVLGVVGRDQSGLHAALARRVGFSLLFDLGGHVRTHSFHANGLPVVVVAGRDGIVRYASMNRDIDVDAVRRAVMRAINEPSRL